MHIITVGSELVGVLSAIARSFTAGSCVLISLPCMRAFSCRVSRGARSCSVLVPSCR
jgi:hypothetical protein